MLVCLYCHLPAKKTSLSVAELIQQKTFCVCSFLKNLYKNKQILWLGKIFSTCYCLPSVFISSASAWTCRQSHTHGLEFSIAFLVSSARFCVLQAAEHFRGEAHPLNPGGVPWILHCICVGTSSARWCSALSLCVLLGRLCSEQWHDLHCLFYSFSFWFGLHLYFAGSDTLLSPFRAMHVCDSMLQAWGRWRDTTSTTQC